MCVIWIGLEQSDSKTSQCEAQYSRAHNAPTEMGFHYNKTYFRVFWVDIQLEHNMQWWIIFF